MQGSPILEIDLDKIKYNTSQIVERCHRIGIEVIEVKSKPSMPTGTIGRDAFGNIPEFIDIGVRKRAIVSMGKQDVKGGAHD